MVTVGGAYGEFVADAQGLVVPRPTAEEYADIVRIDLEEFETRNGRKVQEGEQLDILEVGFWTENGEYEPPDQDFLRWREREQLWAIKTKLTKGVKHGHDIRWTR